MILEKEVPMEPATKRFRKRDAILNCIRSTDVHPGAEWVYEQVKTEIPDISLATVYRNLNLFKEQGLIVSVATVNGVERFDGNTAPHVHFICNGCGNIVDLHTISVPEELNSAATKASGGQVSTCQLTFTGLCENCT